MNETVKTVKRYLTDYYNNAVATENAQKQNREKMPPDMAKYENEKLNEALKASRERAEAAIIRAGQAAENRLKEWENVSGDNLTPDIKLLEYGVTPEQFNKLTEKHQNNVTMLQALKAYADRENEKAGKPLYNSEVPTTEERREAIAHYMRSASAILNMCDRKGHTAFDLMPLSENAMTAAAVRDYGTAQADPRADYYNAIMI